MEGFTYENQGQNTYLVYHFDSRTIDTMALGMLTNNKIKGFAPAIYTEINNEKYIKYNVSSHVTLSKLFMGAVMKARILKTFMNITDAMMLLDAYMLDKRAVILNQDYIYVDASTSDVSMICVPVVDEFGGSDEREFFKNIIFSVSFSPNENGDYVAKLLAYLNGSDTFSLQEFKKLLETLMAEPAAPAMPGAQPQVGAQFPQNNNPYQAQPMQPQPQMPPMGAPAMQPQPQMSPMGAPAMPQQPQMPPQNRPVDMSQEPAIQNVYVASGASAKDIKMAKRDELLRQQEEDKAKEMAMRMPVMPENTDMGFAVPGMGSTPFPGKPVAPVAPAKKAPAKSKSKGKKNSTSTSSEDDVSFFYLMQHYSKENVEKYKATKERKKSGGGAPVEAPPAKQNQSVIKPISQTTPGPARSPYQAAPGMAGNPYQTAPSPTPVAPSPAGNPYQAAPSPAPAAPSPAGNPYQASPSPAPAAPSPAGNPYQAAPSPMPAASGPAGKPYQAAPNLASAAPSPAMSPYQATSSPAPAAPRSPYQAAPSPAGNPYQAPPVAASMSSYPETDMDDDSGTTVLTAGGPKVERKIYLYQVKNGKKHYLDRKTNKIGKNREVVDIYIDHNTAISRCHAIIYKMDDGCYIEDLNSTNGTFVDDQQITSNTKTLVRVGSRVKLGDEEFELRYD